MIQAVFQCRPAPHSRQVRRDLDCETIFAATVDDGGHDDAEHVVDGPRNSPQGRVQRTTKIFGPRYPGAVREGAVQGQQLGVVHFQAVGKLRQLVHAGCDGLVRGGQLHAVLRGGIHIPAPDNRVQHAAETVHEAANPGAEC